jgi:hypothetical protein
MNNTQHTETTNSDRHNFSNKIAGLSSLACNNLKQDRLDLNISLIESQNDLKALNASGGLEEILSAQILSGHNLQQLCMALANRNLADSEQGQYFINAAIKLSNSTTQQIALLAKLQGLSGQKIVVEHVEVHGGANAIVGTVNTHTGGEGK